MENKQTIMTEEKGRELTNEELKQVGGGLEPGTTMRLRGVEIIPNGEKDALPERRYPAFGQLVPRDE